MELLTLGSDQQTPTDGLEVLVNDADVFELEDAIEDFSEGATGDVSEEGTDDQQVYLETILRLTKDLRYLVSTIHIESEDDRAKCSEIVDAIMTSANLLKKSNQPYVVK